MTGNLQHAARGAIIGAILYAGFVLMIAIVGGTNTLQPMPLPVSGLARMVGLALLLGAVAGGTFAQLTSRSGVSGRSYAMAGAVAGAAFAITGLAFAILRGQVSSVELWVFAGSVVAGSILGLFAFLGVRRSRRRYVSRRSL